VYAPANDPAALRALYQSQYSDYIGTFSKIVAQKRKIQAMLNDSDAEVDVMDQDDLTKLSMEHKSLKKGLEDIQEMYNKGTITVSAARGGSGSTSD
jgi:RNA polymerase II elongation factor ELL